MEEAAALRQVERMLREGADLIDIGAYSSRPGADDIPEELETERIVRAVRAAKNSFPEARISVDSFRSGVARAAVSEGAALINDISGGQADRQMLTAASELRVSYIGMHMRGNPRTMSSLTEYEDLTKELIYYFSKLKSEAAEAGITDLVIDPGFGFAKTREQNLSLLSKLDLLHALELPLLVGLSRKSFIYKTLETEAEQALNGTTVAHTMALLKGAHILRVHDVREAVECVRVLEALGEVRTGAAERSGSN